MLRFDSSRDRRQPLEFQAGFGGVWVVWISFFLLILLMFFFVFSVLIFFGGAGGWLFFEFSFCFCHCLGLFFCCCFFFFFFFRIGDGLVAVPCGIFTSIWWFVPDFLKRF